MIGAGMMEHEPDEIHDMVKLVDTNGDGRISESEFMKLFKNPASFAKPAAFVKSANTYIVLLLLLTLLVMWIPFWWVIKIAEICIQLNKQRGRLVEDGYHFYSEHFGLPFAADVSTAYDCPAQLSVLGFDIVKYCSTHNVMSFFTIAPATVYVGQLVWQRQQSATNKEQQRQQSATDKNRRNMKKRKFESKIQFTMPQLVGTEISIRTLFEISLKRLFHDNEELIDGASHSVK